jgi:hypothetical protein
VGIIGTSGTILGIVALILIIMFPQIALWLPEYLYPIP